MERILLSVELMTLLGKEEASNYKDGRREVMDMIISYRHKCTCQRSRGENQILSHVKNRKKTWRDACREMVNSTSADSLLETLNKQ
mmetsp:Transcript_13033/g.23653  ORF Transcript_13033/g.23653 Transcript_13033/m.23653 type:complete len:86 (-) Transcript_13033:153-410(-)